MSAPGSARRLQSSTSGLNEDLLKGRRPSFNRHINWKTLITGCTLLFVLVACAALLEFRAGVWTRRWPGHARAFELRSPWRVAAADSTLVLYIFSNTDPQYLDNLRYFLREGVHAGDNCEYVFVVNQDAQSKGPDMPRLPSNARYIHHANECYDWGTFGWVLANEGIQLSRYRHYIFMNSSVRGPFMPAYMRGKVHWADVLTSRLTEQTKLVGATINCEGSPAGGDVNGDWRRNPHVQSYLVATDAQGLQVLLGDPAIWRCYESMWDTIFYSELGSSAAILNSGYNIAALMVRYQGVDWRDQSNWGCNGGRNPYGEHYLDGGSLEATEVMFVKVKQRLLNQRWSYPTTAVLFDSWLAASDAGSPEVHRNTYADDAAPFKLGGTLAAAAKGPACFDCEYYRAHNTDLPSAFDCPALFEHYINNGQFEGREFMFKCEVPDRELLPYTPSHPGEPGILPQISNERIAELLASAQSDDGPSRVTVPDLAVANVTEDTATAGGTRRLSHSMQGTVGGAHPEPVSMLGTDVSIAGSSSSRTSKVEVGSRHQQWVGPASIDAMHSLLAGVAHAGHDDEERSVLAAWLRAVPQHAPQYMNRAVQQLAMH